MGKTAFLFSGQGAQKIGMGFDLYKSVPAAAQVYDLGERLCPGIMQRCFSGDPAELNQTEYTQPCLFLTDLAAANALKSRGIRPDGAAGFSLGELPALACAGVMSCEDAFRLVLLRGKTMAQESALHPGGMAAAVKLSAADVEAVCAQFDEVWPVNYNCPGQVCCAGNLEQISGFCQAIKSKGGKASRLPVSGAFHTPYMQHAAPVLRAALSHLTLRAPGIPIYANRTALPYPAVPEQIAENISLQVCSPVLWEKTLQKMWDDGYDTMIEVGVGSTLTSFVKRTLPQASAYTVTDKTSLEAVCAALSD